MQFSPQFQVVSTGTPRTSWPWRQIPPPHYSRSFGADPPCCRCGNCTWLSTLTKSMPTFSGEVYRVGSRLGLTAAILSTHIRGTMSQPSKTSCCPELHCWGKGCWAPAAFPTGHSDSLKSYQTCQTSSALSLTSRRPWGPVSMMALTLSWHPWPTPLQLTGTDLDSVSLEMRLPGKKLECLKHAPRKWFTRSLATKW